MRRAGLGAAVLGLCLVVVGVRSIGFERVFPGDSGVVLAIDDAQYHARRAAYTFENFPSLLLFDPYLNFPHGALVPWPPLYDFALAAAARAFGPERRNLELVLGWAPVALGLLTALAVYAVGRRMAGPGVALVALAFFAFLPVSTLYTSVGNPDHHAAVVFVATLLLLGHLASLQAGESRRLWAIQGVLTALRVAMLLTWHGSLLYVVLADGLALVIAADDGRGKRLLAQACGCGAASLLGFASLSLPHSAIAGAWSPIELSLLQPATLAGFGIVAGGAARWGKSLRTAGIAGAAGGAILVLAWESLAPGWAYATGSEPFIALNYETQPLWSNLEVAFDLYGAAAILLPLAPVAGLLVARRQAGRASGLFLAGWTTGLLVLSVANARYGRDLAPAVAVSFAILVVAGARRIAASLSQPAWVASFVGLLLVPVLLWGAIAALAPHARRSLAVLQGIEVIVKRPGLGLSRSVYAFVAALRDATPETAGYRDPMQPPEYGIVTPPTLGFVVNALGRRPTPAGNFGPYVGRDGLEQTGRFYLAKTEREAVSRAQALRARYAITTDEGTPPATLLHRLHQGDGSAAQGRPALGRFRLVTEAPVRGVPLGALRGAAPPFVDSPYKLFEIVEGAVLRVAGEPGGRVLAEVDVSTPTGRTFTWRSVASVSDAGIARIRAPYATDSRTPARPMGPYRVRSGAALHEVSVGEDAVARGLSISVP